MLQQISSQLGALTAQVTELKSELEEVREENAAIREQTGAPKTKRLAYLGGQHPERLQVADEPVAEKEDSPWKLYDKQGFADDFEEALENVEDDVTSSTGQPRTAAPEQATEGGTPMSDDDVQRLLSEAAEQAEELHPDAKPEQAAGGAEEPTDDQGQEPQPKGQDLPTAAQDEPAEPKQAADSDEEVTDDEIQQLLAGVAETAKAAAQEEAERR
ncbi:MAG: hypothetical protein IIC73_08255, partial [Armatimonadetes bacterium]|nr:hypothetical protein [Armatimonadota bacterium]